MELQRKFLASKQTGFWNNIDSHLQRFTKSGKTLVDTNYQLEPRKFLIDYYEPSFPDAGCIL